MCGFIGMCGKHRSSEEPPSSKITRRKLFELSVEFKQKMD
jgi:hypothetical protein